MALAEQCAPEKMRGSLDILCFQTHRTLQHLDALAKPKIGSVLPRTNAPYCTVPCGGSCERGKTDMFMNTARYHESEERRKISRVKPGSHRFKLNTNSGGLRRARDVAGIASLPDASAKQPQNRPGPTHTHTYTRTHTHALTLTQTHTRTHTQCESLPLLTLRVTSEELCGVQRPKRCFQMRNQDEDNSLNETFISRCYSYLRYRY